VVGVQKGTLKYDHYKNEITFRISHRWGMERTLGYRSLCLQLSYKIIGQMEKDLESRKKVIIHTGQ
jgi:hypothetical protein